MSTPPERWWGRPLAESRWPLELGRLSVDPVLLGRGVARGDGRPVVLMPGFLAGDHDAARARRLAAPDGPSPLRRAGSSPTSTAPTARSTASSGGVEQLHGRHGRRVALVGHSRGGHYARALAHRRPDRVSHAISLGADLRGHAGRQRTHPGRRARGAPRDRGAGPREGGGCLTAEMRLPVRARFRGPAPGRTACGSRACTPRATAWCAGTEASSPARDCVEVTGSHVGLIFNRGAYRAIAHALAVPELS